MLGQLGVRARYSLSFSFPICLLGDTVDFSLGLYDPDILKGMCLSYGVCSVKGRCCFEPSNDGDAQR